MKVVLIRYSEIHLKGKNRGFFERALVNNIKRNLSEFDFCLTHTSGRYIVSQFDENYLDQIVDAIKNISQKIVFVTDERRAGIKASVGCDGHLPDT